MLAERWAGVREAPLYEVSTEGRVRRGAVDVERWENARGYLHVSLESSRHTFPIVRAVHRLVLEAFTPAPLDDDLEGHHVDGNKRHNALVNLQWVTHAENVQHAWDSGLQPRDRARRGGCLFGHPRSQVYVDTAGKSRVRCARCRRAHYHRAQAAARSQPWLFADLIPRAEV